MAQLGTGGAGAGDKALRIDEATALLLRTPCVAEIETVALAEAEGRVLAEPLLAPISLPGFDNSAVDGYAVRFDDLMAEGETVLVVDGRATAGHPLSHTPPRGCAVRIFTGAVMPDGTDTVFMQEDCRTDENVGVILPYGLKRGANRRLAGEDVAEGSIALKDGRFLRPEDVGLAAALGLAELPVRRRLRAAIFSTGDEIVAPGEDLRSGAIYDANRFMLHALLRRAGVEVTDLGMLRDDPAAMALALEGAARAHDLVLTSGGVSVGEEDHVKAAISEQGRLSFWRLAIKPGRPVAMGAIGETPFVGLPGNPVAVFVTFVAVVRPLIAALSGAKFEPARALTVASGFSYKKKKGRREYVRASLQKTVDGQIIAERHPVEGAAVLTSLTRTNGFVELPEEVERIAPGDSVPFIAYDLVR